MLLDFNFINMGKRKKSYYKLLNNLEDIYQQNYSATVLGMSKAILVEVSKEAKKKK